MGDLSDNHRRGAFESDHVLTVRIYARAIMGWLIAVSLKSFKSKYVRLSLSDCVSIYKP